MKSDLIKNNNTVLIALDTIELDWAEGLNQADKAIKYNLLTFGFSPEQAYIKYGESKDNLKNKVAIVNTVDISATAEKEAREYYLRLIKDFPNDFEHILLLGEFYYSQKNWRKLTSFVDTHAKNTKFYNVSGIDIDLSLLGANIKADSLTSVIFGGISFSTPNNFGKIALKESEFSLHKEAKEEWLKFNPEIILQ